MRALVTGAGGFVGRHLVAHLRACGDEVTALDRAEGGVDVTDAPALGAVFDDARPEAVYHLAAIAHVHRSWGDASATWRVNTEGTLHVLEAAAAHDVQRVLVVGSAEEYGVIDADAVPVREDAPLRPKTPYGASKVAADFLALQAFLGAGLPTLRVRPFSHTGPGQTTDYVVPALARRLLDARASSAESIPVGNLDPVRDLLDVRDVVRAYRLLVEHGEPGEAYNVCSGRGHAVREIAERLIAHTGARVELVPDPALVRPVEVPVLIGDPSKLTAATGWRPEVDLDTTLADVLAALPHP